MRYRVPICGFLLLASVLARSGELLDRIVATVNNRPILQSELEDEIRYEAFMSGRNQPDATSADRKEALNRLIDQELIKGQARPADTKRVNPADVDAKIQSLKAEYAKQSTPDSWAAALLRYGIGEDVVRERVTQELADLLIVDARLRPAIQIDPQEIKTYYEQKLLPALPPGQHTSLRDATPQIRELLVQEHINQQLEPWLHALREQADIRYMDSTGTQTSTTGHKP